MAVKENKVAENVRGKFYVDDQCIACGLCREIAPEFFGNIEASDNSLQKNYQTIETKKNGLSSLIQLKKCSLLVNSETSLMKKITSDF